MRITLFPVTLGLTILFLGSPASADIITVQTDLKYGQTEARTMLEMINNFRCPPEGGETPWYWNEDNTEKIEVTDLQPLELDQDLENMAMQRAAEIVLYYSHTRPNGETCFSLIEENGLYLLTAGENLAAGDLLVDEAFTGLQETDEPYEGQGHRRNMLDPDFDRVGIGHVQRGRFHYWVQEFGSSVGDVEPMGSANDRMETVTIQIDDQEVVSFTVAEPADNFFYLEYEETAGIPTVTGNLLMTETWPEISPETWQPFTASVTLTPDWNTGSAPCVRLDDSSIYGYAVGAGELTGTALGQTVTKPVYVNYSGRIEPDFELPQNLTTLEAEAFRGVAATAVALPAGVTEIGSRAFALCSGLKQISIPALGEIGIAEDAFEGCSDQLTVFCQPESPACEIVSNLGIDVVRVMMQ